MKPKFAWRLGFDGFCLRKMQKLMDAENVIATFEGADGAASQSDEPVIVGHMVDATCGNWLFDAEALETDDVTVKIEYKLDDSEAELPKLDVKSKPAGAAASTTELTAGLAIEAKFGSCMFDAEVVEVTGDIVMWNTTMIAPKPTYHGLK